ncbi:uncharacterized protein isoform X2 [Choristoneura fumiferana]
MGLDLNETPKDDWIPAPEQFADGDGTIPSLKADACPNDDAPPDIILRPSEPAFTSDAALPEKAQDENDNDINEEVTSTMEEIKVVYTSKE